MQNTSQPDFRRTQLTRKDKTVQKTACVSCSAFQVAPLGDPSLLSFESEHQCSRVLREARNLFESAALMQQDMRKMQTALDKMRKRIARKTDRQASLPE